MEKNNELNINLGDIPFEIWLILAIGILVIILVITLRGGRFKANKDGFELDGSSNTPTMKNSTKTRNYIKETHNNFYGGRVNYFNIDGGFFVAVIVLMIVVLFIALILIYMGKDAEEQENSSSIATITQEPTATLEFIVTPTPDSIFTITPELSPIPTISSNQVYDGMVENESDDNHETINITLTPIHKSTEETTENSDLKPLKDANPLEIIENIMTSKSDNVELYYEPKSINTLQGQITNCICLNFASGDNVALINLGMISKQKIKKIQCDVVGVPGDDGICRIELFVDKTTEGGADRTIRHITTGRFSHIKFSLKTSNSLIIKATDSPGKHNKLVLYNFAIE